MKLEQRAGFRRHENHHDTKQDNKNDRNGAVFTPSEAFLWLSLHNAPGTASNVNSNGKCVSLRGGVSSNSQRHAVTRPRTSGFISEALTFTGKALELF